jgi:hypothetical protein
MYVYVHVYLHTYITVKWPLKDPRSTHPDNAEGVYSYSCKDVFIYKCICMCVCIYV